MLFDDLFHSGVLVAWGDDELAQGRDRALVVRDREFDPAGARGVVALTGKRGRLVIPDSTGLFERDPTLVVRLERLFVPVGSGKTVPTVSAHPQVLPGRGERETRFLVPPAARGWSTAVTTPRGHGG